MIMDLLLRIIFAMLAKADVDIFKFTY